MLSKKELFNAKSASEKIEKGLTINVVNVGTYADTDKDGKPVTVSVLVSDVGLSYTSISATVANSIDMLDEIIAEDGEATVEIVENVSNSGRKFYQLKLV